MLWLVKNPCFIRVYTITKSMHALWLVNQLWFIVPVNPWKNHAFSELLYKSNRPQVSMVHRLPTARDLQIRLVFYQHPAWFISLWTIETCGLLLKWNIQKAYLFFAALPLYQSKWRSLSCVLHCNKTFLTFENTRSRNEENSCLGLVFFTFPLCSQMPIVFYITV